MDAMIQTARGPVPADALGRVLMHEHTYMNWTREFPTDGLVVDRVLLESELTAFVDVGGKTLIDLTPAEMTVGASPDPAGLLDGSPSDEEYLRFGSRMPSNVRAVKALSEATGVHIVLGTGHYRESFFDDEVFAGASIESLTEAFVRDLTEGFPGGDGIRAGIIGEIGSDGWRITPREELVLRAASRAQLRTGVAISLHAVAYPTGIAQVEILREEKVDPSRIIVGHCDTVHHPGYHEALAKAGVWVQLDTIRGTTERDTERKLGYLLALLEAGYADRVLLSQDIAKRSLMRASGHHGYTFLFGQFLPMLAEYAVSAEVIDQLVVDNPARSLSGVDALSPSRSEQSRGEGLVDSRTDPTNGREQWA